MSAAVESRGTEAPPRLELVQLGVGSLALLGALALSDRAPRREEPPLLVPGAARVRAQAPRPPLGVRMRRDGSVELEQRALTLAALEGTLRARSAGDERLGVVLEVAPEVAYGSVRALVDTVRRAGLHRIAVRVDEALR